MDVRWQKQSTPTVIFNLLSGFLTFSCVISIHRIPHPPFLIPSLLTCQSLLNTHQFHFCPWLLSASSATFLFLPSFPSLHLDFNSPASSSRIRIPAGTKLLTRTVTAAGTVCFRGWPQNLPHFSSAFWPPCCTTWWCYSLPSVQMLKSLISIVILLNLSTLPVPTPPSVTY